MKVIVEIYHRYKTVYKYTLRLAYSNDPEVSPEDAVRETFRAVFFTTRNCDYITYYSSVV